MGAEISLPVAHPGYRVLSDIGLIANALTQCSSWTVATWIDVAIIITFFGMVWPFWCWCAVKLWYHSLTHCLSHSLFYHGLNFLFDKFRELICAHNCESIPVTSSFAVMILTYEMLQSTSLNNFKCKIIACWCQRFWPYSRPLTFACANIQN